MTKNKSRKVGVRLLKQEDVAKNELNHFGHPQIGWHVNPEGFMGMSNAKAGFGLAWLMVQLPDPENDNQLAPTYNAPAIFENAGVIILAKSSDGRYAFVENHRYVGDRLPDIPANNYIQGLNEQKRWAEAVEDLGRKKYELPAGLAPASSEHAELEMVVKQTAKMEAQEEAGIQIANLQIFGSGNMNPTFFPYAQSIVTARITSIGEQSIEDYEAIGKFKLFSPEEIVDLAEKGEIDDMKTFGAFGRAGIKLPFNITF